MIADADILAAGRVNKPHGIKGELSVTMDRLPDAELRAGQCIVMEMDGLRVPFFIETSRRRGSEGWLVKLADIDDERSARLFALHPFWILAADYDAGDDEDEDEDGADGFYVEDLVGYAITDAETGEPIGEIVDYDDSTANVLFIVERAGEETRVLIPVADEYISAIDPERRTIAMNLPEGLL